MCDASAAVALGEGRFVVADDETNALRAYSLAGGDPVVGPSLSMPAGATPKAGDFRELDLEGAARIGEVVWWIGSHGNNKRGKARPGRHRLLATSTTEDGRGLSVVVRGRYDGLLAQLARLGRERLDGVSLDVQRVAPKAVGGTNIEGLAGTPEGHLLVGFRNPISAEGRALVVRIGNPDALVDPLRKAVPQVVEASHLALGGLGIRSLEWMPRRSAFLIMAGPPASGGPFRLYRWTGQAADPPIELRMQSLPSDFTPEAMFETTDGRIWILSDDGTVDVDGEPCKEAPVAMRSFRGMALDLE
jgi:hypothetical protein